MAFTRIRELDALDAGDGGTNDGSPQYWHEDIIFLINEENPTSIIERNIVFHGQNMTGLTSDSTTNNDPNNIVIVKCPPFFKKLEERFKNEP